MAFFWFIVALVFFLMMGKGKNDNDNLRKLLLEVREDMEEIESEILKTEARSEELEKTNEELEKKLESYGVVDDLNKIKKEISIQEKNLLTIKKQIELFESEETFLDCALYRPQYDLGNSEKLKEALLLVRQEQKEFIKSGVAIHDIEYKYMDSNEEKEVKSYHKLMLRAFLGESDSIISNVKWNNIDKSIEKIQNIKDSIDKISLKSNAYLSPYLTKLKVKELQLKYEYELKLYEEKEEQRRIKEQMREEEKAQRELDKAQKDAEKEEERYQKALDDAKEQLLNAHGEELEKLNEKMRLLETELQEAKEKKERALSMAQQTKAGHVYVISNIGSFGEDVYKIGMTRRLDPMDRVKELGDASVPFEFDVHGIIYSNNAPELENLLHKEFDTKRVNMINNKKEFFNVNIEEIENIVKKYDSNIELTKLAEAKQYRESVMMRNSIFENTVNVDYFKETQLGN